MKKPIEALQQRIAELLKKNQITLYRLHINSGVSYSTLKTIMNNGVDKCMFDTVILIANGFNMSISEFLDSPLFDEDNLHI